MDNFVTKIEEAEAQADAIIKAADQAARQKLEAYQRDLDQQLEVAKKASEDELKSRRVEAEAQAEDRLKASLSEVKPADLPQDRREVAIAAVLERVEGLLVNS